LPSGGQPPVTIVTIRNESNIIKTHIYILRYYTITTYVNRTLYLVTSDNLKLPVTIV